MKIKLEDINPEKTISVTGQEPWLDGIYRSFATPPGKPKSLVSGVIHLHNVADGMSIEVSGKLSYQPYVDCSRCAEPITWDISANLRGRFVPALEQAPEPSEREEILSEAKAECYEILADKTINLEPLINDRIQLEVPLQTIKKSEDLESCLVCGRSVSEEKVYAEGERSAENNSPFAALKQMKVKH